MEAAFSIPSDLPLLPQFKDLATSLGGSSRAYQVWYLVWQDLYFRAQEGGLRGVLPADGVPGLVRTLAEVEPDPEKCQKDIFEKAVVGSKLLIPEGDTYVCPRFMVLNAQAGRGGRESLGGSRKAFLSKQRRLPGEAFRQGMLIPANKFTDENGAPLGGEEVRRITRLVISCDNALYKAARQPHEYTEGVIQEARRVLKKFSDEEIDQVVNCVSLHRDHPYLNGMNAEQMLPIFEQVMGRLH